MIIPSFVFAFGAPIKIAGTASLLVSLSTVSVGILRYWRRGAYADRAAPRETVVPLGAGSVMGPVLGGLLLGIVPAPATRPSSTSSAPITSTPPSTRSVPRSSAS